MVIYLSPHLTSKNFYRFLFRLNDCLESFRKYTI